MAAGPRSWCRVGRQPRGRPAASPRRSCRGSRAMEFAVDEPGHCAAAACRPRESGARAVGLDVAGAAVAAFAWARVFVSHRVVSWA
jgi:hypothetical protein